MTSTLDEFVISKKGGMLQKDKQVSKYPLETPGLS